MLGIAINDRTLSLAELSSHKQQYQLLCYGIVTLTEGEVIDNQIIDSERMGQHIATLVAQLNCKCSNGVTALATNLVSTREIQVPAELAEQDIEAQIRVNADQYIPFPLAQVSLDFEVLADVNHENKLKTVVLVVAQNEHIGQHSDALLFAGLKPKVIDVETQAKQRVLQLMLKQTEAQHQTLALVDIGYSRITIYIVQETKVVSEEQHLFGLSHLFSAIAAHYEVPIREVEHSNLHLKLLTDDDQAVFQPYILMLSEYITLTLNNYAITAEDNPVSHLMLCGEGSGLPQVEEGLCKHMQMPISLANPFADISSHSSIDREQLLKDAPQLMTACGLGMRCQSDKQYY